MKCDQYLDKLSSFLDGELDGEEAKDLQKHLHTCENCREVYAMYQSIQEELKDIEDINLPASFHEDLMTKIKDETPVTKKSKQSKWKWMTYMGTVAAAALMVVVGVNQLEPKSEEVQQEAPMSEVQSPRNIAFENKSESLTTMDEANSSKIKDIGEEKLEVAAEEAVPFAATSEEVWLVQSKKELTWVTEQASIQEGITAQVVSDVDILLVFEEEETKNNFLKILQEHIIIETSVEAHTLSVTVRLAIP